MNSYKVTFKTTLFDGKMQSPPECIIEADWVAGWTSDYAFLVGERDTMKADVVALFPRDSVMSVKKRT